MYHHCGFQVACIYRDPKFKLRRPHFLYLNTCGATDHIPDIERYICTIKDQVCSAHHVLPFCRLPQLMIIHLLRNTIFWLNAVPAAPSASADISPCCTLTGFEITYTKHVHLEFGEYVQTHEDHNNQMIDRTVGGICLGPTCNTFGTHWFLSLATGQRLARSHWTRLPMPREVIKRVNQLGRQHRMPQHLTFSDRHANKLGDPFSDIDNRSDDDDSSFHTNSGDDNEDNVFWYAPSDHSDSDYFGSPNSQNTGVDPTDAAHTNEAAINIEASAEDEGDKDDCDEYDYDAADADDDDVEEDDDVVEAEIPVNDEDIVIPDTHQSGEQTGVPSTGVPSTGVQKAGVPSTGGGST